MKKMLLTLALFTCVCCMQCQKDIDPPIITEPEPEPEPDPPQNIIILYNKPLDSIRHYIEGEWKCHYAQGGIAGPGMIQYFTDFYWTITATDSIKQTYNGTILADTKINWTWTKGSWTNGDSTHLMTYYDNQQVPMGFVVNHLINDTLVLNDPGFDALFYHLTKQ